MAGSEIADRRYSTGEGTMAARAGYRHKKTAAPMSRGCDGPGWFYDWILPVAGGRSRGKIMSWSCR
jgi:hypothetical protein